MVTYDLLVSIFQPTAPLHDGAVIIQEDRIAAAACFLPLTVQPALSRELGHPPPRRHRPHRGERRRRGRRLRGDRADLARARRHDRARPRLPTDLRARLRTLVVQRRPTRGAASEARACDGLMAYHPFRHLGLKFLSIALAGADLAGRRRSARSSATMRVPLEFHNVPAQPRAGRRARRTPSTCACAARPARSAALLPGEVVGGARPARGAARARGCSTCSPTRCACRSASRSCR